MNTASSSLAAPDGVRLSYQVHGTGPAVVFLHGLTANAEVNWIAPGIAAAVVASGRQAILLDARGHGGSQRATGASSYVWEKHGQDVIALLDELGVESCILVGYSLGAGTVAWLLPREPRIRAAVLAGIAPETISQWPPAMVDAYIGQLEGIEPPFGSSHEVTVDCLRALLEPAEFRLGDIDVPVLVLNGADDSAPDRIAATIPGAAARTVPGDHGTAPLSPEFTEALVAFLDEAT